ncbi:YgiQ family radical SAM protein [Blautia sp. An249]|uniref:YgiQ family radical SAM protein n=1 Tax=Blautia sp. An249 TaxID=1965603 RepID=UPI000B36C7F5|nr:YgiQ family radical SAM protein [Blautia sp. An249]OUO80263.1 YgiQ family radical SAM protein [Blautia sp. An249]
MKQEFLPISRKEMEAQGLSQMDFVYITGDAYVDHPSFGAAIISRLLQSRGYSVGIIPQPDWKNPESIRVFGEPRLAFLVTAGNMDSMVNHYTVSKKHRQKDAYSPGGKMGLRPDRAVTVYGNLIRQVYKHTPVILGGIEASLRRLAHYDYWEDKLKRSVLLDSGADLISYGMGEHSIIEIAEALDSGLSVKDLTYIPGTVCRCRNLDHIYDPLLLPSFEEMKKEKKIYAESFRIQYENTDSITGKILAEYYEGQGYIVQNPPARPLTTREMDDIYELPYTRTWHPVYEKDGGIPALEEVKFSLTSNRGCFGGCSFCALTFHQGRILQIRSQESLVKEAESFVRDPDFKGYIHDVGGPTADFRIPSCKKQLTKGVCKNRQCLFPSPCPNLEADHEDYLQLLEKLRQIPGVKKVFIRSGIRFDYVMEDKNRKFLKALVEHHISGQLRVAPEHVSDSVLYYMGKPRHQVYQKFIKAYENENRKTGKKQYALPYFMSSHPGSTVRDAVILAEYIRDMGFTPEQAQDFYPTPSTLSTCMYYTGLDPRTMEPVYVPRSPKEKAIQRAFIQYRKPENRKLVTEGLKMAKREDLIGFDSRCLIRPSKEERGLTKEAGKRERKKKTIRNIHKKSQKNTRKK